MTEGPVRVGPPGGPDWFEVAEGDVEARPDLDDEDRLRIAEDRLASVDDMLTALERPAEVLRAVADAEEAGADPTRRLRDAFGWSGVQAEIVLALPLRLVGRQHADELRRAREAAAAAVEQLRRR